MSRHPNTLRNRFVWRYHRLVRGVLQHRRVRLYESDYVTERAYRQFLRDNPHLTPISPEQLFILWSQHIAAQAKLN